MMKEKLQQLLLVASVLWCNTQNNFNQAKQPTYYLVATMLPSEPNEPDCNQVYAPYLKKPFQNILFAKIEMQLEMLVESENFSNLERAMMTLLELHLQNHNMRAVSDIYLNALNRRLDGISLEKKHLKLYWRKDRETLVQLTEREMEQSISDFKQEVSPNEELILYYKIGYDADLLPSPTGQ